MDVADCYGWLSDIGRLRADYGVAITDLAIQKGILQSLLTSDPNNNIYHALLIGNQLGIARIDAARGALQLSLSEFQTGHEAALYLARIDPADMRREARVRIFDLSRLKRCWK